CAREYYSGSYISNRFDVW
nr:immunoglobulin heavy chain junction region [Macaca mulatta]MOW77974.1 immunoglobulin heavy chain junction region [Macaca mulatta]MOW77987.1 immunoglobulin heavy chain junction region [Macaca mulatta]MOW86228.1 immunoglobulin heavy chain junction region [Macaca mulatta]